MKDKYLYAAIFLLAFLLIGMQPVCAQVTEEWVARYNGPGNSSDWASGITVDSSGNVYVTGGSWGSGTFSDYATVKYDSDGNEIWVARYNGPTNGDDYALGITVDSSGNVYVTGVSSGGGTFSDYATVKYDSDGNEIWVGRYDGPENSDDWASDIAVDSSGNVYVSGGSGTFSDYATIKYDSAGNEIWVVRYNGPGNYHDYPNGIAADSSGNVYVSGGSWGSGTFSDYATVKYDSAGNEIWVVRYNGPGDSDDRVYGIAVDSSGNVYVTGGSFGNGMSSDYATIKYSQSQPPAAEADFMASGAKESIIQPKFSLSQNYPNPFVPETTIEYSLAESCPVTLKIYNLSGQLIKNLVDEYQDAGHHKIIWHGVNDAGQEVARGVYFYQIKAGDFVSTKKMAVLK